MRIHHLNCVSSCPLGGRLMDGRTPGVLARGQLCCHCLLVEGSDGLTLIDTGFGLEDVRHPRPRLSVFFLALLSPDFREEMTAIRQVERLGFAARDVRHIVLTHLDFDHAGGLDDFPWARVHMLRRERDHAIAQRTWLERQRYRPRQWSYQSQWVLHGEAAQQWRGFEGVSGGEGLPRDILLVPLPGHTFGHAGVAVHADSGWMLLAGDAYFHHGEMDPRPYCTPGLRFYQWMMEQQREQRLRNQQRLRELQASAPDLQILCSHDPVEFERVARRSLAQPPLPVEPIGQHELVPQSAEPVGFS
jgi:glyoxylase-like metal-dependent hydrolase (beta-lactamase superfamily II)